MNSQYITTLVFERRTIFPQRVLAGVSVALMAITGAVVGSAQAQAAPAPSSWSDQVTDNDTSEHAGFELDAAGPTNVFRIAGSDRFATSARVALQYDAVDTDTVFIANGLDFPDALSAAPAAAYRDAPLLLTRPNSLPAEVRAQIVRLQPVTIYVVGGPGVISAAVFNQLDALATDKAIRLFGADRYSTSRNVFETIWAGDDTEAILLADGRNYPDALSGASGAGAIGNPVVLVNGGASTLPTWLTTAVATFNTELFVLIGGEAVLSSGIEDSADALVIDGAIRLFGTNRYKTSVAVNNVGFNPPNDQVFLAVGTGYADALSGAALAGALNSPLYLVPGNCVPQDVLDNIEDLNTSTIVLMGGTGVLGAGVQSLKPC